MSGSRPTVGIRISADGAEKARRELEALGPAGQKSFAAIQQASSLAAPEMQKLGTSVDVVQRSFVGMGGSLGRFGSVFTGVAGVAGALTTGFVALGAAAAMAGLGIAKAGDEATATLARLSSATGGLSTAQGVYESLFRLSQQTGVAVAESAGSFARFSVAAKEIGATNDQVLRLVSGIQKAGIVAGASAQETGAAVQQIGQALASGKLQGDELRSLLENMPQFAQALARELGVGIGQLRQMGSEGKLTADLVFPAMLRAGEKMSAEFEKMPVTMSRAKDILNAATEDFGARLDRITGLSQTFAGFMLQGAAALNAAGRLVAPTAGDASDQRVAAAERRMANLRAGRAADAEPELTVEQRRAQTPFPRESGELRRAQSVLAARGGAPRDASGDRASESAEATAELSRALHAQSEIRAAALERDRLGDGVAAQQARDAAASTATTRLKETAADLDARYKARQSYQDKIKTLDEDERKGGTLPDGVSFLALRKAALDEYTAAMAKQTKEEAAGGEEARKASEKRQEVIATLDGQTAAAQRAYDATLAGTAGSKELSIALEVEAKIHQAGIPLIEKRTAAEKEAAKTIEERVRGLDRIKDAEKKYEEETKKTKDFADKSWNELASIGERAMDRLGDAIVNAFTSGNGAAINFGNIARGIIGSVVTDIAKLAIINPILNSLFTSTQGARPTLSGAFGGGATSIGGGGGFGGIGSMLSSGWDTLSIGGYLAGGGGFSGAMLGTPGFAGGMFGEGSTIATSGMFGTGGNFAIGSLGSTLGGMGAGFGIGSTLGGFIAKSSAHRQNSQIGAALGSIIGAIGGPLGSVIGGALGGAGGGMIGPGESVKSYGLRLQSQGWGADATPTNEMASGLMPVSRQYFNESGAAVFQQADQVVAAVNAYLAQRGLQVGGVSIIGGNKSGPDGSGDAGNLSQAFTRLRFSSKDETKLTTALTSKVFDDPAKLQSFVEGFYQVQTAIADLAETAEQKLQKSLDAVGKQFDDLGTKAREYGLAETGLADAKERALQAVRAQTQQAGVSMLRDLAFGAGSALAPEQQYFAAITTLNKARGQLDAGGTLDEYTTTARQVLPVARDFLGVTERYAALVSEVAGVLTAKGGDATGLGALLQSQSDGSDALRDTFARYGQQQVDVATATLSELRRLGASIEALIARRAA